MNFRFWNFDFIYFDIIGVCCHPYIFSTAGLETHVEFQPALDTSLNSFILTLTSLKRTPNFLNVLSISSMILPYNY